MGDLARLARSGDYPAGRELIRRAIDECEHREDLRDPVLSEWLKDFLSGAISNPRQSLKRLIAPREEPRRVKEPSESVSARPLSQEAYGRVRRALKTGVPRKRVFNDVARELNALGYRNPRNEPLRASSIERQYYDMRRRKNGGTAAARRRREKVSR
jgi:hypothetical protein